MTIWQRKPDSGDYTQITASNAATFAAGMGGTVRGDGGIAVVLYGMPAVIALGDYVFGDPVNGWGFFPKADFEAANIPASISPFASALAFGQAAPGALSIALSGTKDIDVPLSRAMPDANYTAVAVLMADPKLALLGSIVVVGVVGRTTSTVTVRVRNTGVATVLSGLTISVLAMSNA